MTQPGATPLVWGLLLGLGVIWGSSFLVVELALTGFTPLQIAAFRIAIAACLLTMVALASGRTVPPPRTNPRIWAHIAGFAIFSNAMPFALLSWGQTHVASGFAGVTMSVVPLLILPLAHVFVPSERLTPFRLIGFAAGFAGALILVGPGAFVRAGGSHEDLARLACVLAASCYATGSIITRTTPPGTSMIGFSAAALVLGTVFILPLALFVDGWPDFGKPVATLALFQLGLIPTALATLFMVRIIRSAGPSFFALVNYQVPVWSVILGAYFLAETLPPSLFWALALILIGLAISQYGPRIFARR